MFLSRVFAGAGLFALLFKALRPVTFGDYIELFGEELQMREILRIVDLKELVLDLDDLTLICNLVEILNVGLIIFLERVHF